MSKNLVNIFKKDNNVFIPKWSDCSFSINKYILTLKTKNGKSIIKLPSKLLIVNNSIKILSNKSSLSFLKSLVLFHHKKYFVILRLKGSNYRFSITDTLNLEIGKSHKTIFNIPHNININRYAETKDSFMISGLNIVDVNNYIFKLRQAKPINCYTGSGLLINKEKVKLKQGKKK